MDVVPLVATPNQTLKIVLGDQNCQINVNQKEQGLFVDLLLAGVAVVSSIVARESDPIVCRPYAGFQGNLVIIDTQGSDDPRYTGLGTRWQMIYFTSAEYVEFFK